MGGRELLREVQAQLSANEAALGSALSAGGEAGPGRQQAMEWGLACVLGAYRLAIACAQVAEDKQTTLEVRVHTLS